MKAQSIQQFAIVKENTAASFQESLNATIRDLSDKKPTVTFSESDPLFARICYTETVQLQSESDEERIEFRCEDCPMFSPIINKRGIEDKRYKYGECEFSEYGRTYKTSKCCEHFYRMFKSGRIGLCWQR